MNEFEHYTISKADRQTVLAALLEIPGKFGYISTRIMDDLKGFTVPEVKKPEVKKTK